MRCKQLNVVTSSAHVRFPQHSIFHVKFAWTSITAMETKGLFLAGGMEKSPPRSHHTSHHSPFQTQQTPLALNPLMFSWCISRAQQTTRSAAGTAAQ